MQFFKFIFNEELNAGSHFSHRHHVFSMSVVYLLCVVIKPIVGFWNLILLSPMRFATVRNECAIINNTRLQEKKEFTPKMENSTQFLTCNTVSSKILG